MPIRGWLDISLVKEEEKCNIFFFSYHFDPYHVFWTQLNSDLRESARKVFGKTWTVTANFSRFLLDLKVVSIFSAKIENDWKQIGLIKVIKRVKWQVILQNTSF